MRWLIRAQARDANAEEGACAAAHQDAYARMAAIAAAPAVLGEDDTSAYSIREQRSGIRNSSNNNRYSNNAHHVFGYWQPCQIRFCRGAVWRRGALRSADDQGKLLPVRKSIREQLRHCIYLSTAIQQEQNFASLILEKSFLKIMGTLPSKLNCNFIFAIYDLNSRISYLNIIIYFIYLTSTFAPTSSSFAFILSASSLLIAVFKGFGAPSTRSFASFNPKLVSSLTTLIT